MKHDGKVSIKQRKKLQLNKETLRQLNNEQLGRVAGGDTPSFGNQNACSMKDGCVTDDCV